MEPRGSGSAVRGGCPGRERERSRLRARSAGMETLREGTGTRSRPAKPRGMEGAASPAPPGEVSVCLSVCLSISAAGTALARPAKMPQTWGQLWDGSTASYKSKPRMSSMCVRAPKDLTLPPSLNYLTESGLTCLSSEHYSRSSGRRRCRWIQDSFGASTFASWTGSSWGLIMGKGGKWGGGGFLLPSLPLLNGSSWQNLLPSPAKVSQLPSQPFPSQPFSSHSPNPIAQLHLWERMPGRSLAAGAALTMEIQQHLSENLCENSIRASKWKL